MSEFNTTPPSSCCRRSTSPTARPCGYPGRSRHRDQLRRPGRGRRRLGAARAPSGSTSSTSTPRSGAATTTRIIRRVIKPGARSQHRAVRRHPRRRERWRRPRHGREAHQPRHGGAGEPRVGGARHRRVRRGHRRRPRRARHHPRRPRLDARRAATSGRCSTGSRHAGCARYVVTDVTKDGTLQGPNLELLARGRATRTDRAGHRIRRRLQPRRHRRRCATWCRLGVEGAIIGKALYAGRVHPRRGAGRGQRLMPASRKLPAQSDSAGQPWAAAVSPT